MFADHVRIHVAAGDGGDGSRSFRREAHVPRGGPDGGDGGDGGDVILVAEPGMTTLGDFRRRRHVRAKPGGRGPGRKAHGRNGHDVVLPVPPGTVVRAAEGNGEPGAWLGELLVPGDRLVVARGGRGGRGNVHFVTPTHRAPTHFEKGQPGEERWIELELKLIADIGLIGVPNAGKSTLLSVLTNAKPKIAPYPFTTLEPNLGVANIDDHTTVVLADIPGLIEGAAHGAGLGHDFLRHIQRTRVLIHLLDGLSEDPVADYSQINSELSLFDPNLAKKPQIVALNKIDQPEVQERLGEIEKKFNKLNVELMTISALARTNTRELLLRAYQMLQEVPPLEEVELPLPVYKPKEDPREFNIIREGVSEWRISGAAIERAASMTYWQHDGSVRRFQKIMETLGVDEALRKAGVQEGDTVSIGEFELEWQE
jgi:GTP-binding protein